MIEKIIELSIRNRFLVLVIGVVLAAAGIYATVHTPMDAIPDLSENQVIVFTDWMGRSPREIEDQVTYPLSRKLQGLAGVKAVRSSSEFNFSMITIIFEEGVDFYFARQRVTEKLSQANTFLPAGVVPYLAPDATALGQVFWYTVEPSKGNTVDPGRLWALNKFYIAPQLNAAPGVADVAVVGGLPLEYQIDVRPEDLRAYDLTLGELFSAVARSNMPAGGGVVQKNNAEYIVRGVGWIRDKTDIENTVLKEVRGTPIYVKNLATVQLGTQFRRSVYEKNGNEVTGGAVLMRHGENPLTVTERVKEKIQELQPGLPDGIHIVPAYDRTRLIHGAIHTLTEVMWHEMIIASIAILLILSHVRSVFVICVTLPLAVLFSFLTMWVLRTLGIIDIQANIMSMAGITISIGILVDQAIVMTENATHHLKEYFGEKPVTGDTREIVIPACKTVGRPIFFSVLIMLISFIPVFMLSGREGKLFHPLAFTKSFALIGVALISITIVPALIPTFLRGRLKREDDNWIVRSFSSIYRPLLTWALPRRNLVTWMFAVLLIPAAGIFPLQALFGLGSSETAWEFCFFVGCFLVIGLTVIFTIGSGKHSGFQHLLYFGIALLLLAACIPFMGLSYLLGLLSEAWLNSDPQGGSMLKRAASWLLFVVPTSIPLIFWSWLAARTNSVVLSRTLAVLTLTLVALWSYGLPKIGVSFMPALDEGTTLDMPITVPRASVTQSADDLKARDALLRGFPEVESVIGKAGRADTPTDPAPLDMVETFVNFRPKRHWPKRVLRYPDAARQSQAVLQRFIDEGLAAEPQSPEDQQTIVNDATQKAIERFDETMRELALRRYGEFEVDLETELTRFAVEATLDMIEPSKLNWPSDAARPRFVEETSQAIAADYGPWLSRLPAQEDVSRLAQDVARRLKHEGVLAADMDALELNEPLWKAVLSLASEAVGGERHQFDTLLLDKVAVEHERRWSEQVARVNWELFDRGTEAYTWYALEEVARSAKANGLTAEAKRGDELVALADASLQLQLGRSGISEGFSAFEEIRNELEKSFHDSVFFWQRKTGPKGDLVDDEMGRVLQVPGWSNIFTQPIINRIEMLSTGVRTDIGVKVFGPDLDTIDKVCKEVEAVLKPVPGARDTIASPIMGKGYIDITIRRQEAARYGISIEDVQNEIEMALAGRTVTFTVEKRDRFPVRIRYARASREDEESIRRLLISPNGMSLAGSSTGQGSTGMGGTTPRLKESQTVGVSDTHADTPSHLGTANPLIPLSAVADVNIVEGPAMIKSENGRLLNYVTLNVRGRDIVGFVEEAKRAVAQKISLPEGVHLEWSGEFEHQVRAAQTLRFVFPAVLILIFVILYLTYKDLMDAVLMMLAVPEALAGGAFFMYVFPKIMNGLDAPPLDFSVAVWVGFIACFGMATETGIIMLVYLREAIDKRGGLENIQSLEELRQAVIEGAVHRLRPKLLTEGVAIVAIFPMVFATGVGGEILAPMALPVLGGLLVSDEVVDLFLPVRFYWVRRARWLKLQEERQRQASAAQAATLLARRAELA